MWVPPVAFLHDGEQNIGIEPTTTNVTLLSEFFAVVDHFFKHRVDEIAELKGRGFLGQCLAVELMRFSSKR